MPAFCDVALPVPLDRAFTYALGGGYEPYHSRGLRLSASATPTVREPKPNVSGKNGLLPVCGNRTVSAPSRVVVVSPELVVLFVVVVLPCSTTLPGGAVAVTGGTR